MDIALPASGFPYFVSAAASGSVSSSIVKISPYNIETG